MIGCSRPLTALAWLAMAGAPALAAQGLGPTTGGIVAREQHARMLGHHRRALMIAAHPDDENTEVLTLLARGEGAETAYLSLTRGEGGQNLIGTELGEGLGLIRSGELLAARSVDGARQFFTRAADFGFSKSIEEAWRFWPRDSVLKDVVRVIRRFRPQVIITVFTGTPADGHGQHQAAGWAAAEGFRVAGDPAVFPELEREEGLAPFTPLKFYRSSRFDAGATTISLDGGRLDRAVGQSFRQIAMRSRSLHRSQDQGSLQEIGPSAARLQLVTDRTGAGAGLWDGVDTAARAGDADQAAHLARVRAIEAGLVFDAVLGDDRVVRGQSVSARFSVWNAGAEPLSIQIGLAASSLSGWVTERGCLDSVVQVAPNTVQECAVTLRVPSGASWSVPYYLAQPRAGALYRWTGAPATWGLPFDADPVVARFEVGPASGDPYQVTVGATFRIRDQAFGEVRRPLQVVPRVGVRLDPSAGVWPTSGGIRELLVTLRHGARDTTRGTVTLELPAGWPPVAPQTFLLSREDEAGRHRFEVRMPVGVPPGRYEIRAVARTEQGERQDAGVELVDYPHIAPRLLPRPAVLAVRVADLAIPRVGTVGYIRGASDRLPEALREAGLAVELLDRAALAGGDFSRFEVIVVGSRAFETDTTLLEQNARLLEWVRGGGRLVVQYQQQAYFNGGFAPLPMALAARGHDRVTDEQAPVTLLKPEASLFQAPNQIGAADWDDWVQERGLYFATTWDPAWSAFLESHDPGESPLRGGLLAARIGRGTYIYTGLSFFRQLPAAVPGALRLFLNLLAYEHGADTP